MHEDPGTFLQVLREPAWLGGKDTGLGVLQMSIPVTVQLWTS